MSEIPLIDPELASLLPPPSEEERELLEQNILEHHQCRDAIITWDNVILDGHHRFEICMKHGIRFAVKEMSFDSREEAKVWMLENQLGRRNLTDAMRIELALAKAELLHKRAKENQSRAGGDKRSGSLLIKSSKMTDEPVHVRKSLAAEADVSERTLYNYMQIRENAAPELLNKVKQGEVKINTAHRILTKEIMKNLHLADCMYTYIAENMPYITDEDACREVKQRLDTLSAELDVLINRLDERLS